MATPATPVTITIAIREKIIEVNLEDPRSLGFLSSGAASQLEYLYDGHGNLVDPQTKHIAEDLANLMEVTRDGFRSATS